MTNLWQTNRKIEKTQSNKIRVPKGTGSNEIQKNIKKKTLKIYILKDKNAEEMDSLLWTCDPPKLNQVYINNLDM